MTDESFESEPVEPVSGEVVGDGDADPTIAAEAELIAAQALIAERTSDLQRLSAEYANYKKRVDRDRLLARQAGIEAVVGDLMPVLDSVELARSHGDLEGGFRLVADELEKVSTKYGLVTFGAVGEAFDPTLHDALMQVPYPEPVEVTTVAQVLQVGYKLGDRVIRPARVAIAQPGD